MRSIFLGALAAAAISGAAVAGDWRATGITDNFITGMDYSRVRDVLGKKVVWVVKSYREAEDDGTIYRLSQMEIDCVRQIGTTVTFIDYNEGGEVTYQSHNRQQPMPIAPDTVAESWMMAACDGHMIADKGFDKVRDFHEAAQEALRE